MYKKKALIIDDEVDFCLLLRGYLKEKRFDVTVSHTLKSGLAIFRELKPDVVFLDNNLPDGLGWEQLSQLYNEQPEVKYYLISAFHPILPAVPKTMKLNMLEKPISFRQLEQFF